MPESNPIIVECQRIWTQEQETYLKAQTPEPVLPAAPEPEAEPEPEPEPQEPDLFAGVLPYDVTYNAETESLAIMLAKIVYGESRGIWSTTEQACIIWTVLNRVDAGMYGSVYAAIVAPYQFAYSAASPTTDDYGRDLLALARDVLYRWHLEREGQAEVGRVLPRRYCWYGGDGSHNYFRSSYAGRGSIWFGLKTPYEN